MVIKWLCPEYAAGNVNHPLPYMAECPVCLPHPLSRPQEHVMGGLRPYITAATFCEECGYRTYGGEALCADCNVSSQPSLSEGRSIELTKGGLAMLMFGLTKGQIGRLIAIGVAVVVAVAAVFGVDVTLIPAF